jgi:hypothetical protein
MATLWEEATLHVRFATSLLVIVDSIPMRRMARKEGRAECYSGHVDGAAFVEV